MRVLGINCFSHDTVACLLANGRLVALAEEERFNRERHTKRFPEQAIGFCLAQAGIGIGEVNVVAFAHRPGLDLARGWPTRTQAAGRPGLRRCQPAPQGGHLPGPLALPGPDRARRPPRRHAASAFFPSPFERAAVLTLDRGGDFLSTTLQLGTGSRLARLVEVRNPDSLGEVYSALTWYLGFAPNADEGKTMGLAPYGRDKLVPELASLVRRTPDGLFRDNLAWFAYHREGGWLSRAFLERYGPPRVPESDITELHEDLAFAVQDLLEETALHVARALQQRTGLSDLCLAGGVALNTVMNARLLREAGFQRIFIQPAASGAGNALGAALWVWHQQLGRPRGEAMSHAYFGAARNEQAETPALAGRGLEVRAVADPADEAARLLAGGKVVGWFQGRAEVGPRALGARSILADPRWAETRDIVNARVKRREAFRPFAPSVLDERGHEFFNRYQPSPFMLLVQPVRAERRAQIPGSPRGRHRAAAVGHRCREPAVPPADQPLRRPHRGPGGPQHPASTCAVSRSCTARPRRSPTSSEATWTRCSSAPSWPPRPPETLGHTSRSNPPAKPQRI